MKPCSPVPSMTPTMPGPRRSGARPRTRQRTAMAALALLCAFAGCEPEEHEEPEQPEQPGEPRQVRTSFTFEILSEGAEHGVFLILDEDPVARGQFAGTVAVHNGLDFVDIRPAEATMDSKRVLHLADGEATDGQYFQLQWSTLDLELEDQDGDGVLESGTGRILGGTRQTSGFSDDFTAAPDGFPVTATARRYNSPLEEMAPWESLLIQFGQPVSSEQIQRYRVLADGQQVPGKTRSDESDLLTAVVFVPDRFFPLGATVEVVIDGMENALGVPVIMEHEPIQVLPDPGSILSNLGFEQALAGWYTAGDVAAVAGAGDLTPVEGTSMAALRNQIGPDGRFDSNLIGHLDVPLDTNALDVSLALLIPDEDLPKEASIRLFHDPAEGEHEVLDVYQFDRGAAVYEPCACEAIEADPPLTQRTGPFLHTIDLSAFRGERVFLEIRLHAEIYGPVEPPPSRPAILLVDDLKLR
jgi:hypothetical protein